jgi:mannose-6-phosphate isomerase-like protein (cupin superfamily)
VFRGAFRKLENFADCKMSKMMNVETQTVALVEKVPPVLAYPHQYAIPREEIFNGRDHLFLGKEHGAPITFFWVNASPGRGPRMRKHPYEEIFVVEEGLATFTLGTATIPVGGGNIVIAPRRTPHKFVNSGFGTLKLIAIHCNNETVSEYLE